MDLQKIYERLRAHFGHLNWWPGDSQLEIVVGAILTQNTAWTNVEKAIRNLKDAGALSLPDLQKVAPDDLAQLIRPAGYFNVKAKRLRAFLDHLKAHHGGELERMLMQPLVTLRQELLSINGIGPETADSIILYAAGLPVFVIDAYTRRIFGRLGLTESNASYEELQTFFQERLAVDVELYNDYHAQIVYLGKDFCRKKPKCQLCPLVDICGYEYSN